MVVLVVVTDQASLRILPRKPKMLQSKARKPRRRSRVVTGTMCVQRRRERLRNRSRGQPNQGKALPKSRIPPSKRRRPLAIRRQGRFGGLCCNSDTATINRNEKENNNNNKQQRSTTTTEWANNNQKQDNNNNNKRQPQ